MCNVFYRPDGTDQRIIVTQAINCLPITKCSDGTKRGTSEIHDPIVYKDKALRLGLGGTRPTGALALMA